MSSSNIDTAVVDTIDRQVTSIDYSSITNIEDIPCNQQALRPSTYPELSSQAAPPAIKPEDWKKVAQLINRDYLGPFQVPVDKLEFNQRWVRRSHTAEQIIALRDQILFQDLRAVCPILVELYPMVISNNDVARAKTVNYEQVPDRFISHKGPIGSVISGFKRVKAAELLPSGEQYVFARFLLPG